MREKEENVLGREFPSSFLSEPTTIAHDDGEAFQDGEHNKFKIFIILESAFLPLSVCGWQEESALPDGEKKK
jgi:hypothetical protein